MRVINFQIFVLLFIFYSGGVLVLINMWGFSPNHVANIRIVFEIKIRMLDKMQKESVFSQENSFEDTLYVCYEPAVIIPAAPLL